MGAAAGATEGEWRVAVAALGRARWLRGHHRPREALAALAAADEAQRGSPWGRAERGRALAELGEHAAAAREFEAARRAAPWRLEGMEVFSTVLWHLKRETELALLAHALAAVEREAPETWVAAGNCFSLLKEHDAALRFFQRAIAVAPAFAYAHTLCGHEHVAVDDMDAAAACFRTALLHDPRHYQAWYGLGMIFYRTQRLPLADFHFGEALRLAPDNSALHTYRGMVASKQRDWERALEYLERALQCNPRNVLARSQQAQVFIGQGRLDEGLAMVEQMLDASPREAFLHFLKASACAKRGDREAALAHYAVAMDLDSKNGPLIKTRIERIFNNPLLGGGGGAGAAAAGQEGGGVAPMDVSAAEEEFEV
jgi:anaphase-promoting complex subunit 3